MYLQIIAQMKQRITVGDWPPGTELPSMRHLAVTLRISLITVKRAYFELERAGLIVTNQGKGSFVADIPAIDPHRWAQDLATHLAHAARLGALLGLTSDDLVDQLRTAATHLAEESP
ncbi:GntR family transcriptional regulator [Herpetosiphon gulosus]|uniref:HTH gntR-type domain-containing protein n=1 Tax=Herpetosiphon gulosus TaxID=1973496 RepID=A0ABP9XAP0_9CHLR